MKLYFFIIIESDLLHEDIEDRIKKIGLNFDSGIKDLTTPLLREFLKFLSEIYSKGTFIRLYEFNIPDKDKDTLREEIKTNFESAFDPICINSLLFLIHFYGDLNTSVYLNVGDHIESEEPLEVSEENRLLDNLVDHGYGKELEPPYHARLLLLIHSLQGEI